VKTPTAFLVALAVVLAGCATEAERPAPVAQRAPEPALPQAAPEPKVVATPDMPKRAAAPITLNSTELFEFDRASLTPRARAELDGVVTRAKDFESVSRVHIEGHADPLGSVKYNQALSERRAAAVQAYLVSKGFDASKIEAVGSGETQPVKSCADEKNKKALVACLAPNRRVLVEVKGTAR
jgi:OOP family OmpA-OmpF porin